MSVDSLDVDSDPMTMLKTSSCQLLIISQHYKHKITEWMRLIFNFVWTWMQIANAYIVYWLFCITTLVYNKHAQNKVSNVFFFKSVICLVICIERWKNFSVLNTQIILQNKQYSAFYWKLQIFNGNLFNPFVSN